MPQRRCLLFLPISVFWNLPFLVSKADTPVFFIECGRVDRMVEVAAVVCVMLMQQLVTVCDAWMIDIVTYWHH